MLSDYFVKIHIQIFSGSTVFYLASISKAILKGSKIQINKTHKKKHGHCQCLLLSRHMWELFTQLTFTILAHNNFEMKDSQYWQLCCNPFISMSGDAIKICCGISRVHVILILKAKANITSDRECDPYSQSEGSSICFG